MPRFEYDREADAAYVTFSGAPYDRTEHLDDQRHVDRAPDGTLIGVELLNVSTGVRTDGLPEREVIERLLAQHGLRLAV
jgi:uncharacterized protein YuzE